MISHFLRAVIMGPPGSGKGTISSRIVKDYGLKHVASGDMLRNQIRLETAAGLEAKKYMEKGQLVPDIVMMDILHGELRDVKHHDCLFDGFPRTVVQAEIFSHAGQLDVALNLNVPFDAIIERMEGRWIHAGSGRVYHTKFNPPKFAGKDDITGEDLYQRTEDTPEVVRARLLTYNMQIGPVLKYYRKIGKLVELTGTNSNEIWPLVHRHLSSMIKPIQYTKYN